MCQPLYTMYIQLPLNELLNYMKFLAEVKYCYKY